MINGVKSDKIEVPNAAACSPGCHYRISLPAVSFVEASLVMAVPP